MMNFADFINRKFLEWQLQEGERKTIEQFAQFLGTSQPLLSQWMAGSAKPGPKYRNRIIQLYGDEASIALGDDPRLSFINAHWDDASDTLQRTVYEQLQKGIEKNVAKVKDRKHKTVS